MAPAGAESQPQATEGRGKDGGAGAPSSASSWPSIVRLPGPPALEECHFIGERPWLLWQGESERAQPVEVTRIPTRVDALTFAPPEVLNVPPGSGTGRIVVQVKDGWLVAMHRGEFGGGLFWVEGATLAVQQLDAHLGDYVGWIGASEFGVVGVAGVCHGEACTHRTSVYEIFPWPEGGWRLKPLALFDGCPRWRAWASGVDPPSLEPPAAGSSESVAKEPAWSPTSPSIFIPARYRARHGRGKRRNSIT